MTTTGDVLGRKVMFCAPKVNELAGTGAVFATVTICERVNGKRARGRFDVGGTPKLPQRLTGGDTGASRGAVLPM